MGELLYFYAASDMAFVGGSLVPVGGYNMLEPAALKLPIVCGPHCFNFIRISELLLEAKGMRCIHHLEELTSVLTQWLSDPSLSKQLGAQAATVVEQNQGALKRLSHLIEHLLEATNKR
jgi:3-deoxy-D-manno-octulosonic-acid transferase